MKPKTWTEVLIEKARLRGYIAGWTAATKRTEGATRLRAQASLTRLGKMRPCESCPDGWMDSAGYPGYRHPCAFCNGTGIAPEGGDK
jgi:hypothetical protein